MDRDVAGKVLDNDGKPAVGVSVHLFQGGGQTTTTDVDGHFIFHGVPPGLVSFDAGLPQPGTSAYKNSGMARGMGGDTNIVIRLGTNPDPGSAMSQARITTSGTVFDPSGKPAPGVLLAMVPSGGLRTPVQSDANGKYTLQWPALFIRAKSSTKPMILARDLAHNLAATGEIDTNTTSLDLHLQPGLTLSAEVRDSDGRQVTNAIVQLMPYPPGDKRATLNQMPPTNASPEGLYFFSALPQGAPYRVWDYALDKCCAFGDA
jgi:protocatechuate 3,4-dioxygenase beta subunit